MKPLRPWATLLLLLLSVPPAVGQTSQMTFTLPEGPYRAGFRAVEQYDRTRTFEDDLSLGIQPRPLQTSIWYPARVSKSARPMRYKQYAYLTASETSFPPLTPARKAATLAAFASGWGLTDSARHFNELEAPTRAFPHAPQAPGNFPVVVYGPSFSAPSFENSVLAEYLASHGYIVISSPSMGWHQRGMTGDLLGMEAQARDMEFLLAYTAKLPGADTSRVAAMGFSWGGLSDVVFQLRNPRVDAVIALDGSIAYFWSLFKIAPSADLGRMDVPFLFLQSAPPSGTSPSGNVDTVFTFFDSLSYSDAYRVRFYQLQHQNFGAHFVRLLERGPNEADQATVNYGYEQIARYTLNFLDAYLRKDGEALAFLARSPEENGIWSGFATVDRKQALKPAATLLAFSRSLGAAGPASAPEALARIRETNPGYRLPEEPVNSWGYELLRKRSYDAAIGVLRLNTIQYPKSSNTWDSLGEAYMDKGERDSAIVNYERSLALDSTNTNAVTRLVKLRAQ